MYSSNSIDQNELRGNFKSDLPSPPGDYSYGLPFTGAPPQSDTGLHQMGPSVLGSGQNTKSEYYSPFYSQQSRFPGFLPSTPPMWYQQYNSYSTYSGHPAGQGSQPSTSQPQYSPPETGPSLPSPLNPLPPPLYPANWTSSASLHPSSMYPGGHPNAPYEAAISHFRNTAHNLRNDQKSSVAKSFPFDTAIPVSEDSCSTGIMDGLLMTGFYQERPEWRVELDNGDLWRQFQSSETEMILTKSGRHIFPPVWLRIGGLVWDRFYHVVVSMVPTSAKKHKFQLGKWTVTSRIEQDAAIFRRSFSMSEDPIPGYLLQQEIVKLTRLKITNNSLNNSHIFLQSMKKYRLEVTVYEVPDLQRRGQYLGCKVFSLPFTEFIAVTAYQNAEIRSLKIENNPFAKGFRDNGKRKPSDSQETT